MISSPLRFRLAMFAAALSVTAVAADDIPAAISGRLYVELQALRQAAALAPLSRPAALERVARSRAAALAAAPADQRLPPAQPLAAFLSAEEILRFRSIAERIDLQRGAPDPVAQAFAAWRDKPQRVALIRDPRVAGFGIGVALAADGTIVVVTLLLDQRIEPPDPAVLEARAAEQVNRLRAERDLPELALDTGLSKLAREHSDSMARRQFFAHQTPEGLGPARRLSGAGIPVEALGQLIGRTQHPREPVASILQSWTASEDSRRTLYGSVYRRVGIGVAVAPDGMLYFTQLLVAP